MVQVIGRSVDRAQAEEEAKLKKEQKKYDLERQMSTVQGRKFVWDVLHQLKYNLPIQDINAKVYGAVALQEVALAIAKELKGANRDLFYQMEVENER